MPLIKHERLPFEPEPAPTMLARFLRAVDHIHDADEMIAGRQMPPSGEREHVFDFDNGLRLILSRDFASCAGGEHLHMSASAETGSDVWLDAANGLISKDEFCGPIVVRALASIKPDGVGSALCMELIGYSAGKGVPHYRGEVPEAYRALRRG